VARVAQLPEPRDTDAAVLVAGPEGEVSRLVTLVRTLIERGGRDEQLVELLLKDVEPGVAGPEHLEQLRLQAQARAVFLTEVPLLTSREVGEFLGSTAGNTSAMANRLKRAGTLFAVTHKGIDLYPAAQIVEGEASPAIAGVLEAFAGESAWTIALWLNAPSGWLGGRRPLEVLGDHPDRVVDAARKAIEPLAV
jgi:hypothetical protein